MKQTVGSFVVCMLLVLASTLVVADWNEDDGHKMHYPQLPDPVGWDVYATQGLASDYPDVVCADDWTCSETGWVMDIHFWGSWKGDVVGEIRYFDLAIAKNIPADPPEIPYSRPGEIIWERKIAEYSIRGPFEGDQGWYCEPMGEILYPDHKNYYQYNVFLTEDDWFWQDAQRTYWLLISANVSKAAAGADQAFWGWKSSRDHYLDDAVFSVLPTYDWIDLYEPNKLPIVNHFWLEFDQNGKLIVDTSGGLEYFDDGTSMNGWYYYPNTGWYNMWFYDHPLDFEKMKEFFVQFFVQPINPNGWVAFALNWATDAWPPGNPPPIPPLSPENETLYVGRQVFLLDYTVSPGGEFFEFFYDLLEYNPEWVSVDFMGANIIITRENPGMLQHQCLYKEPVSLDLAFVINGRMPLPDLDCDGSLRWTEVEPGSTVTGSFDVTNIGEVGSLLDWEVTSSPSWGTWTFTPSSGTGLAVGSTTTVAVSVDAPDEGQETFTGNITVCNKDDTADCCTIPVSLTTPVVHSFFVLQFLSLFLERFPLLKQIVLSLLQ